MKSNRGLLAFIAVTVACITSYAEFVPENTDRSIEIGDNTMSLDPYQGISQRKPNTTLNFPQAIPLFETNSYTTVNAFPGLVFTNPLATAIAPGESNRLYVLERSGYIQVITNLAQPSRTQFLDLSANISGLNSEGGLLGLAFHPDYISNRYFFVFYTPNTNNGTGNGLHTRVSRFQTTATNQNLALVSSETILYSQFNSAANHNGGDLHFGPDGYLYIATGDEGGGNDTYNNAQIIDKDFFAGLLRVDVDMKPGSLAPNDHPALGGVTNYAIPPDNPFIGTTNYFGSNVVSGRLRTEFYAVGLRNPFRFSFDTVTSDLYVGDVGQNAWEEINLVTKGGNYGWAAREGFVDGPKPGVFSSTNYINPLLAYGHGIATNQGSSVTGGRVYRGDRFPELVGRYIFSDYVSGHIWSLTHNGRTNTSFAWLATDPSIVHFGEDPTNGDLLLCDLAANQIKRLERAVAATNALPATLAEAGIFADLEALLPYEGIVPYTVNVPFWSDGAFKRRWFSVPSTNLLITFNPTGTWIAPTTTVWIKHFDLLLTSGVPSSVRRLETRVMVKSDGPGGGYGVTYRWGNSTTNAVLVPAVGLDEQIVINESGIIRTQIWQYPSRGACLSCHNVNAGFTLSFTTPQMNITQDFGDTVTNQVAALQQAGYFSGPVSNIHLLRKLAHATNTEFSVAYRARSYLDANCSQCHRPGGPVPAAFDANIFTPLSQAGIIDGPLADDFGNTDDRVIRRGAPPLSMILTRISTLDLRRMPQIGSTVLDTQSIALITAWITDEASAYETYEEWQELHFGSTEHPDAQPDADPDGDGNSNLLEYRTGTQPTNSLDVWVFDAPDTSGPIPTLAVERTPNTGFEVQVTTNLINGSWYSLDVPENAPVFSSISSTIYVPDPDATNHTHRYYRTRVYEP
ncbi:MAG TPA: PQQ-dependent sugar dehydrogenase [Kiritimatiellia bacterium]|nr:PQQ-dependent sugar dehydrogenase [Kiritimatiellia bacterium]